MPAGDCAQAQNTGRPPITQHDRRVLVMLASKLRRWQDALDIVKPDMLTKWHRQGFRFYAVWCKN